jgi:ATP-dependent protease ClpP protease subunit
MSETVIEVVVDAPIGDPTAPDTNWPASHRLTWNGQQVWPHRLSGYALAEQIRCAEQSGARVLLLRLHRTPGGELAESEAVHEALRSFSRAGGVVVAHVSHKVGSCAPLLALAADFVVIDPAAQVMFHSALSLGASAPGRIEQINEHMADLVAARSLVRKEVAQRWFADTLSGDPEFVWADAPTALALGLADAAGPLELAQALARQVADGGTLPASARPRGEIAPLEVPRGAALATLQTSNYGETTFTAWSAGMTAAVGNLVSNAGNVYVCTLSNAPNTAGSTGPTGTGLSIIDGNLRWAYVSPAFNYATAGGKLETQGIAIKTAAANLMVGRVLLANLIQNFTVVSPSGITANSFAVTFPSAQPDLTYAVHITLSSYTGGAYVVGRGEVTAVSKDYIGVVFSVAVAVPGTDSATYTVSVIRAP